MTLIKSMGGGQARLILTSDRSKEPSVTVHRGPQDQGVRQLGFKTTTKTPFPLDTLQADHLIPPSKIDNNIRKNWSCRE